MKSFEHVNASSFDEAAKIKAAGCADIMAGGTDLMNIYNEALLEEYPKTVVNIKSIPDAEYVKKEDGTFKIGALTKLNDVAKNPELLAGAKAVAEAAKSVATPLVRNIGTIGGNICQDCRCWYYRYPHQSGGRIVCERKGGEECWAIKGDNRYHSIFGAMPVAGHVNACTKHCPAGTNIPAYMAKLRDGDMAAAAAIIMEANPMPMITSRVCAHTCQEGCNRAAKDECVNIHAVERSVGDYILAHVADFYKAPAQESGKKVAVVGAGPAGLAAAYYLRQAGNEVVVYDKMEEAGGLLMYALPAYRMPKTYVSQFTEALKGMGIKFQLKTAVGEDITTEELESKYDNVFFATGAWKRPVLGFDGEEFTEFGLDFLTQVKAWTDNKKRNNVVVTGGGNVAMDVAITVKRLGAENVTMACLESEDIMPASKEEIARAREEGIEIMPSWGISKALYDGDKVKGIELVKCESVFDETGRFNPSYDQDEKTVVDCDSILMAVGQRIDLSFLDAKYEELVERGRFKVDEETQATCKPSVFAGGDAASGPSTVIKAVRSGRVAAENMNKAFGLANPEKYEQSGFRTLDREGLEKKESAKIIELPAAERAVDKEDTISLTAEATKYEASRCMNCGCYSVNASDISPVLVALDAELVTNKKTIKARDFFTTTLKSVDMLDADELVTEIDVPDMTGYVTHYEKLRIRSSIDFALVSLASAYKLEDGKFADIALCYGGVAPIPLRLTAVEEFLKGKAPSEEVAKEAAELAVKGAAPLDKNTYRVSQAKALVERFILGI